MKETPLTSRHIELGAKMAEFAGYNMPISYSTISEEHHAVRLALGIFDVSHMGEFIVRGPEATAFLQSATSNDVSKLKPGEIQYSCMPNKKGGIVDDLLVYRLDDVAEMTVAGEESYMLVVNASNEIKDWRWLKRLARGFQVKMQNISSKTGLIAVQGPKAVEALQKLTDLPLGDIKYYNFRRGRFASCNNIIVSATGYTGAGGFEIYGKNKDIAKIWDKVMKAGAKHGIKPCGLGARNTLRLEAGMALYGHEISATINPVEAGLLRNIDLNKDFVGKPAVVECAEAGPTRKLCGIEMTGRGIARDGYEMFVDGAAAGWVTSGSPSPTLNKNIAMCYLPASASELGRTVQVLIRGQQVDAVTVPLPFYKRAK